MPVTTDSTDVPVLLLSTSPIPEIRLRANDAHSQNVIHIVTAVHQLKEQI